MHLIPNQLTYDVNFHSVFNLIFVKTLYTYLYNI